MANKIFLYTFFLFTCFNLTAQKINWEANLGIGGSKNALEYFDQTVPEYQVKPGLFLKFGGSLNYKINDRLSAEIGLDYLNFSSRERREINYNVQFPIGIIFVTQSISTSKYEYHYLALPLKLNLNYEKMSFFLGYQWMFLIAGESKYNQVDKLNNGSQMQFSQTTQNPQLYNDDSGFVLGYQFMVTRHFGINLETYIGLKNIFEGELVDGPEVAERRNRLLNVGLTYRPG